MANIKLDMTQGLFASTTNYSSVGRRGFSYTEVSDIWNTCPSHKLNLQFLTPVCVLNVHKRMVKIPFQFLTLETVKDRLQCHGNMAFLFWPKGVNRKKIRLILSEDNNV